MGDPQPVFNIVVTGAGLEPGRHDRMLPVRGRVVERDRDCTGHRAGAVTDTGR